MPVTNIKTDNARLADKVALRLDYSPWPKDTNRPLRVLDLFGGHGVVWAAVARKGLKQIHRVPVDMRHDMTELHIHGDNRKVLAGLDLNSFDVVDIDAYGIPVEQLTYILQSGFQGTVFFTAIQTMHGTLPSVLLDDLGFPKAIRKKAPTLPARRGWALMCEWLAMKGVRRLVHRSEPKRRKHYACFNTSGINDAGDAAVGWSNPAEETAAGRA